MKRLISSALFFGLTALAVGHAPAFAAEEEEAEETEAGGEVTTGTALPPLTGEPRSADGYVPDTELTIAEYKKRELPHRAYLGADQLKMDPQFVNAVQVGLEQIFNRDYNDARDTFEAMDRTFPDTPSSDVIDMLIWQALMLENFDFKYDKQYWTSSAAARKSLKTSMAKPGNEAWEELLMATVVGIESIHTIRKGDYLPALSLAFQAMGHIEGSKKAAPDFVDLQLADGLYNYWRSVITLSSKALPDFGDERVKGIEQMEMVEKQGVFLKPLATLSLAFTWIEEKDYKKALISTSKNRRDYPNSIVNNLVAGTISIYRHDYEGALKTLAEVERIDPKNMRAKYWKGVALLKSKKPDEAKKEFDTYLAYEHLEDFQKSWTTYRIGQCYAKKKEWGQAYESYLAANKIDSHKPAKAAADRLKKRKKDGKIKF